MSIFFKTFLFVIKNNIKKITWHFYYFFIKIYFSFLNTKIKNPIIILTPGKVASSTIYFTLKNYHNNVFHVHNLNLDHILNSRDEILKTKRKSVPNHNLLSEHLSRKLIDVKTNIFYIIILRNPVNRFISEFFQNLDIYGNKSINRGKIDRTLLKQLFIDYFSKKNVSEIDEWVEREINNRFNINIYTQKVNTNYEIFKVRNHNLLVLKSENFESSIPKGLNELFENKINYKFISKNIGFNKWYGSEYILLKKDFNEIIYQSFSNVKVFNYFYSDNKN